MHRRDLPDRRPSLTLVKKDPGLRHITRLFSAGGAVNIPPDALKKLSNTRILPLIRCRCSELAFTLLPGSLRYLGPEDLAAIGAGRGGNPIRTGHPKVVEYGAPFPAPSDRQAIEDDQGYGCYGQDNY